MLVLLTELAISNAIMPGMEETLGICGKAQQ
jgi:hypothetical protein